MKDYIGQRIKDERTRLNLTQDELIKEAQLDWDRQTLGQVENGERDLKAWELAKISKVLQLEMSAFFPHNEQPTGSQFVLWRDQPVNHERADAEFIRLCKEYKFVEDLNKIDINRFRNLPIKKVDLTTFRYEDAYILAEEIRSEFDLGDYPASSLIKVLEERYGIKFFFNKLDGNGSAASSVSNNGSCILISSNEPAWRQNFSIAHELYHIVTWDESLLKQIGSTRESWGYNEKLANAFAAGLLVPSEALRKEISLRVQEDKLSDSDIVTIARQFDVSLEALLWRMVGLFIIEKETARKALYDGQLRALDKESHNGANVSCNLSNRFIRLAYLAYENGKISRARLAKMLNSTLSGLPQFLKQFGLAEVSNNEIPISHT